MNNSNRTQIPPSCTLPQNELVYLVFFCVVVVIGIVGNIFVLYVFRSHKSKQHQRKSYEILIWYLSLFDLISLIISTHEIYERSICYSYWPFGSFACKLIYPTYYVSINISVCILLIIALDRYRCIVTPFKKKFTSTFIHFLVFISVLISYAMEWYQFHALYYDGKHCRLNKRSLSFTLPRVLTLVLRDIIFIVVFIGTACSVYISFEERRKKSLTYKKNKTQRKTKNRRVWNMLVMMGVIFCVLILPYDVWDCTMSISRMLPKEYRIKITTSLVHLDSLLSILQLSNMIANCFIYSKMHRHFNARLSQLFHRDRKSDLLSIPLQSFRLSRTTFTYEAESAFTRAANLSTRSSMKSNSGSIKSVNSNNSIPSIIEDKSHRNNTMSNSKGDKSKLNNSCASSYGEKNKQNDTLGTVSKLRLNSLNNSFHS